MEVISSLEDVPRRSSRRMPRAPNVTFVQQDLQDGYKIANGLVIVLDVSAEMKEDDNWKVIRYGLEQMFTVLQPDTKLTLIHGGRIICQNCSANTHVDFWEGPAFPEDLNSLPNNDEPLTLSETFEVLKDNVLDNFSSPRVLIMTAQSTPNDNLDPFVAYITEKRLAVDIMTVPNLEYPDLLKLTKFGSICASKLFQLLILIKTLVSIDINSSSQHH